MMYFFIGYVIWCILFAIFCFGYEQGYKEAKNNIAAEDFNNYHR